jgi:hypothetical protein
VASASARLGVLVLACAGTRLALLTVTLDDATGYGRGVARHRHGGEESGRRQRHV